MVGIRKLGGCIVLCTTAKKTGTKGSAKRLRDNVGSEQGDEKVE